MLNDRETQRFYICKSCDIEVTEEKALEDGFSCEECADIYELNDNTKSIREAKTRITKTEKNLELIQGELEDVRKKLEASRKRVANKLEKEKKAKSDLLKKAKAAAKKKVAAKKVAKKAVKKVAKKAVKKVAKKAVKKVAKKKVAKKAVKKVARKKVIEKKVTLASKLKKKLSGKR